MLNKGKEWKLLWNVPEFKLFKEDGRSLRLDEEAGTQASSGCGATAQRHRDLDA